VCGRDHEIRQGTALDFSCALEHRVNLCRQASLKASGGLSVGHRTYYTANCRIVNTSKTYDPGPDAIPDAPDERLAKFSLADVRTSELWRGRGLV